jgi:hypothetical protein
LVLCGLLAALLAAPATADVVLDWNEILLDAIRVDRTPPPRASRAMAMTNVAVFDAVNGILGGFDPYHVTGPAPAGASPEAAAAAAAHAVLSALFPALQATFDAELAASLAAVPDGAAKNDGILWGQEVAAAILALRANDRSAEAVPYYVPVGARWWVPTLPAFAPALAPNWPLVTPWTLASGSQLRSSGPPPLDSPEFTAAFREVKLLGRVDSTLRTPEQTQIALFWADGAGTATPPGHWLVIAAGISLQRNLTLAENARLFALLSMTVADAAIVSWDHKYAFDDWRPITAIQQANTDGNPLTQADPGWLPLIVTPPFPSFTSGHSTFSASSSRLVAHFFGTDDISFSTTSDGLPGVVRSFDRLSQAGEEAGQSRIYGGIHWQYDNTVGLASGRALADHAFFNFLSPTASPSSCSPSATALCLNGGRFKVEATFNTGSAAGNAQAVPQNASSGQFWFFQADNTELTVKVLTGCGTNDRFWVFASGLTDVEVQITVTDTEAGRVRRYFNPGGQAFQPVQDTAAFATCP